LPLWPRTHPAPVAPLVALTSLAQNLALEDTRSRCIAQWNYMPDNDAAHLLDAGDEPARILELISPTGFEEFFREPLARAA